MKVNVVMLITLMALNLAFSVTIADQTNISNNAWEQHSENLSVLITMVNKSIIIHIKNTSDNDIKLANQGLDGFVKLYYIDSTGEAVRFGVHRRYNDERDDQVDGPSGEAVLPGAGLTIASDLTPNVLALIKAHLVKCSFIIYDPAHKRQFTFESSPKLLSEKPTK